MSKARARHLRSVIKHINSTHTEICVLTRIDLYGSLNCTVELIFIGCFFFFFFRGIGKRGIVHQLSGGKLDLFKHLSSSLLSIVTVCVVGEGGDGRPPGRPFGY